MVEFLRTVTEDEIAEVARLAREIWHEYYVRFIGPEQVDYMLDRFQSEQAIVDQIADNHHYYLISSQGESVGYLAIMPEETDSKLFISKINISKSNRGSGFGKESVEFIEKFCGQNGIRTIWLTVNRENVDSIAWYERQGFRITGKVAYDIGKGFVMDDYKMEKSLTAHDM